MSTPSLRLKAVRHLLKVAANQQQAWGWTQASGLGVSTRIYCLIGETNKRTFFFASTHVRSVRMDS